jgi:hypothetical protein
MSNGLNATGVDTNDVVGQAWRSRRVLPLRGLHGIRRHEVPRQERLVP